MAFCRNCGQEIPDEAVICVHCGVPVARKPEVDNEPASGGMKVICFLIPFVGLILYLTNNEKSPIKANDYGKMALIGFIVDAVFYGIMSAI